MKYCTIYLFDLHTADTLYGENKLLKIDRGRFIRSHGVLYQYKINYSDINDG